MWKPDLVPPENPDNVLLDQEMNEIFDILSDIPVSKMTERVFRKNFLPFINPLGIPKEDEEKLLAQLRQRVGSNRVKKVALRGNLLNMWLEYVDSIYHQCEVYDDQGQLAFVVPPLVDRSFGDIKDQAKIPMIVQDAFDKAGVLPILGTKTLNAGLLPLIGDGKLSKENMDAWDKIFNYYGLPTYSDAEKVKQSDGGVAATTVTDDDGDEFEVVDEFN